MSQCSAPVLHEGMIRHRSSRESSPRCQRGAKVWLPGAFGWRGFCRPHAKLWKAHNKIVSDILAL